MDVPAIAVIVGGGGGDPRQRAGDKRGADPLLPCAAFGRGGERVVIGQHHVDPVDPGADVLDPEVAGLLALVEHGDAQRHLPVLKRERTDDLPLV